MSRPPKGQLSREAQIARMADTELGVTLADVRAAYALESQDAGCFISRAAKRFGLIKAKVAGQPSRWFARAPVAEAWRHAQADKLDQRALQVHEARLQRQRERRAAAAPVAPAPLLRQPGSAIRVADRAALSPPPPAPADVIVPPGVKVTRAPVLVDSRNGMGYRLANPGVPGWGGPPALRRGSQDWRACASLLLGQRGGRSAP